MLPQNTFYNEFDYTALDHGHERKEGSRTPFELDRDRIIYSSAFRRLQSKTQVFVAGDYDFYRTRLTHSMEVSQIGRSICNHLNRTSEYLDEKECYVDPVLVEAACLAHDIGHPSFGHAGEDALNRLMDGSDGYEGNAQNLRILTELFYAEGQWRTGMRPTRAFVDAMLKYKALHGEYVQELNADMSQEGLNKPDNHFLYNSQRALLDFVFSGASWRDHLPDAKSRNSFKSLECQIMDWADDVAYSTSDLQDGIEARFIRVESIQSFMREHDLPEEHQQQLEKLCAAIVEGRQGPFFNGEVGSFLTSASLERRDTFASGLTRRYAYGLAVPEEVRQRCRLYKKLARQLVFKTPQVHQLEFKGGKVLTRLFEALLENAMQPAHKRLALLPSGYAAMVDAAEEGQKARIVCDYVSGMTDAFVVKTYKRMFDPSVGSIADLI